MEIEYNEQGKIVSVTKTAEEVMKERRRERARYVLSEIAHFVLYGALATSYWWGWLVFGWLIQVFNG